MKPILNQIFWATAVTLTLGVVALYALPVGSAPAHVNVQSIGGGKTVLAWSMPEWVTEAAQNDEARIGSLAYPLEMTDKSGAVINRLLGFRVVKNGIPVHAGLLTRRNFVTEQPGYYDVEAVYENGDTEVAAIGEVVPPTISSGERSLTMDLTAVIQDSFPRVRVRAEILQDDTAAVGLPLDSFRLWENDQEMTLLEHCFVDYARPVDVVFVLDLSRSMEPRIHRISQTIEAIVDSLPGNINAQFGIVRYGLNVNGALNTPPGWTRFPGSPTHENKDSLYSAARTRQRMDSLTLNTLTGGQEPAYQAILSAIRQTAWRINSERYIILVTDENNDSCRISPWIPAPLLTTELFLRQIRFLTWCNFNIVCDCYDNCPQFGRCDTLLSFGCGSGLTHFAPLFTGDLPVPLENDFLDLWALVRSRLLSSYDLCYDSPACCENGNVQQISGQINFNGDSGGDTITYEMRYCPRFYWSPETQDLIDGPCLPPLQTLSLCADFLNLDSTARAGTAILFYGHSAGGEMLPLPTFRPFPPLFPQRWCASIPADSVNGPYMYISARFFSAEGLPIYYPCDTSRICVSAPPQVFCNVPQVWRCEDLTVTVNAFDVGGSIVANTFCYSIPAQSFDTCFALPGAPPWTVTIPYSRFMFDSVCVRASVTDNEGLISSCGTHCRTPVPHVPVIAHTPPAFRMECTGFNVTALITDPRGDLATLSVEWQCGDSLVTTPLDPVAGFPTLYSAGLPAQFVRESCTVVYRIIVTDHCFSTVTAGPYPVPAIPHCPVIAHNPVNSAFSCFNIPLAAIVSDSGGDLSSVTYGWRCVGDTIWNEGPMVNVLGVFTANIPGNRPDGHCNLEYYIRATDACGCTSERTQEILVVDHPPFITHTPITARFDCHDVLFLALAADTIDGVNSVTLNLWCDTTEYHVPMVRDILPPFFYRASLPTAVLQQHDPSCAITYNISATDPCGSTSATGTFAITTFPHAPTIAHDSVSAAVACAPIPLCAGISDVGNDLAAATVYWRCVGDPDFTAAPMSYVPLINQWCGTIPGNRPNTTCDLEYYIFARDTCGYDQTTRAWTINVTVNPPTILHNPVTFRYDCYNRTICAFVYDSTYAVANLYASFYCEGGDTINVGMPFVPLIGYCTQIPDTLVNQRPSCIVSYRITATNSCGETAQTGWYPISVLPHVPVISHDSITVAAACSPIQVCWRVDDAAADLNLTRLWWKCAESDTFVAVTPVYNPFTGFWCATIPGNRPNGLCDLDYFISARDGCYPVVNTGTLQIDVRPSDPTILHVPVLSRSDCRNTFLCAFVYDSVYSTASVVADFYCTGNTDTFRVNMPYIPLLGYCTAIPDTLLNYYPHCVFSYRITATNSCGERANTAWFPIQVTPHCPVITHFPLDSALCHNLIAVCATISDGVDGIAAAQLGWRCVGDTTYQALPLIFNPLGGIWCATIPADRPNYSCDIEYVIYARDDCGCASQVGPYLINIFAPPPLITMFAATRLDCYGAYVCAQVLPGADSLTYTTAQFTCDTNGTSIPVPMAINPNFLIYCATTPDSLVNIQPSCLIYWRVLAGNGCGGSATSAWMPIPTVPHCPVIVPLPVDSAYSCNAVTACVVITDSVGDLAAVQFEWRCVGDSTSQFESVSRLGSRYCGTIPANRPDGLCDLEYQFTARDSCGCVTRSGWLFAPVTPHCPVIVPLPVDTVYACEQTTVCVNIFDIRGDLTSVEFEWRCVGDSTSVFESVSNLGSRYCGTIPADRPDGLCDLEYQFTARDSCGCVSRSGWLNAPVVPHCPVIVDVEYSHVPPCEGPLVCAVVTDIAGDLADVVLYWTCTTDIVTTHSVPMTIGGGGSFCANIPGFSPDEWCPVRFMVVAWDSCGCADSTEWIIVNYIRDPLEIACLSLGQDSVRFEEDVFVCMSVYSPGQGIDRVVLEYHTDRCDSTVSAPHSAGNYCATIPSSCYPAGGGWLRYTFTAYDICILTESVTCSLWVMQPERADLGDLPNPPYPTENRLSTGPAHLLTDVCWLGTLIDSEVDPYNDVFGDPSDDGLDTTCPDFQAGPGSCILLPKLIYVSTGSGYFGQTLYLSAWFDFNDDGDFIDTVACPTGSINEWLVENWVVTPGNNFMDFLLTNVITNWRHHLRIRLSTQPFAAGDFEDVVGHPRRDGEVEDYLFDCAPTLADLGDLPDPTYPTENRFGSGPAHLITGICWLGDSIGSEDDPYDDVELDPSDDGFSAECQTQVWGECSEVIFTVNVSTGSAYQGQTMFLSVWNDMNYDGDFLDDIPCPTGGSVNEWIVQSVVVTPGLNILAALVNNVSPANGLNYIRVRLSTEPFVAGDYVDPVGVPRHDGEVEDYLLHCTTDACCFMCEASYATLYSPELIEPLNGYNLVIRFEPDGYLHFNWQGDPDAQFYHIYRGTIENVQDAMEVVGAVLAPQTAWVDSTPRSLLSLRNFYQISGHGVGTRPAVPESDCARWEMNENLGEFTFDATGNGHVAWRAEPCPPTWGLEDDADCYRETGYLGFPGYVGAPPNRCESHLEVENSDDFYDASFQLWTRIRLTEEPTTDSGPFYLISNNSFDVNGGGFLMRIDPGWFVLPDGTREYHNRVTAMVWDRHRYGFNRGGWWTIQSQAPTPANPTRGSLPLNEWACVCLVVDGPNSMILINEQIVASGILDFDSDNNGAPLIIGAGYRHNTYPVEYPFRGDIDCLRITCVLD